MTQYDDEALSQKFAAERAQDEARTPLFERVVRGRSCTPARRWTQAAFAVCAFALLAVAFARMRAPATTRSTPLIAFTPGELRVPTDFLLDQAASLRVDAMPSIGAVDWSPLPNDNAPSNTVTHRRN